MRGQVNVHVSPNTSVLEQQDAQYAPAVPWLYCCRMRATCKPTSQPARHIARSATNTFGILLNPSRETPTRYKAAVCTAVSSGRIYCFGRGLYMEKVLVFGRSPGTESFLVEQPVRRGIRLSSFGLTSTKSYHFAVAGRCVRPLPWGIFSRRAPGVRSTGCSPIL